MSYGCGSEVGWWGWEQGGGGGRGVEGLEEGSVHGAEREEDGVIHSQLDQV